MMIHWELHEVVELDKEDLLEFAQLNSVKPKLPRSIHRGFLNDLITNSNLIFDFHDSSGRVACAVLLDKISNLANDACLEILGCRSEIDETYLINQIIELINKRAPKARRGYRIRLLDGSTVTKEFLKAKGLEHYFSAYEMTNAFVTGQILARAKSIVPAVKDDADSVYEVLCEAFRDNREMSISDPTTWKTSFLKTPDRHVYVWKEQEQVIGFAILIESPADKTTEIRIVGVRPSHRGLGIGGDLVRHCLNETHKLGYKACHLSVALENANALGLYERLGFEVVDKYNCVRADFC